MNLPFEHARLPGDSHFAATDIAANLRAVRERAPPVHNVTQFRRDAADRQRVAGPRRIADHGACGGGTRRVPYLCGCPRQRGNLYGTHTFMLSRVMQPTFQIHEAGFETLSSARATTDDANLAKRAYRIISGGLNTNSYKLALAQAFAHLSPRTDANHPAITRADWHHCLCSMGEFDPRRTCTELRQGRHRVRLRRGGASGGQDLKAACTLAYGEPAHIPGQGTTLRIEAGWPGSLKRLPVSVTTVPSTLRIEMSSSM